MLGIHRIRMDVDYPLFWDLLWFAVIGIVPAAIGWMMRQGGSKGRDRVMSSPLAFVLAVVLAGPLAALPPPDQAQVVVLFRPDITEQEAFAAIIAVDGRMIASDASGQLWAVDLTSGGNASELYRYGAAGEQFPAAAWVL